MKRNFIRLLSVFLCAVMVLGLLPPAAASAAETVTTTETVNYAREIANDVYAVTEVEVTNSRPVRKDPVEPMSGMPVVGKTIGSYEGVTYFETFAELQTLAARTYSEATPILYLGSGPLVISADLTLPENLILYVSGQMQVASGVGMIAYELYADELVVNGELATLYAEYYTSLTVNGAYYNYESIFILGSTVVAGADNIISEDQYCGVYVVYDITDVAGLRAAAADAEACDYYNWFYIMYTEAADFTVTQDITVPWNCDWYIQDATVTVSQGATLTLESFVIMYGGLVVNGALINDGVLDIYYDDGGLLTVNGTCEGVGYIYVNSQSLADPAPAVPGLKNYTIDYYDSEYWYWGLLYSGSSNQLGTPTDLGWGYNYEDSVSVPGYISWKNGVPDSGEYQIQVYRDNSLYDTYSWMFDAQTTSEWHSIDNFRNSDPDTGEYYFTVTAMGDGETYSDSTAAMSERWYYTKPDARLESCTNLSMDAENMYWENSSDSDYLGGFEIEIYYSAAADGDPEMIGTMWSSEPASNANWKHVSMNVGEGYYYFAVRVLSSDINQVCNGDWSELSEVYHYSESGGDDGDTGDSTVDGMPFSAYEWEVLKIVNNERLAAGMEPLSMYELIQTATDIRAEELKTLFDHTRPDGTSCFTVFDEIGLSCGYAGENIAWGQQTPAEVMNSWMNSDGHRANILSGDYTHIGIGFDDYNWVQMFTDGGRYTSIDVLMDEGYTVTPGTTIDEMGLVAVLDSSVYGDCYLPVTDAYCTGFNPDLGGRQTVTISVLGVSTDFEITVDRLKADYNNDGVVDDQDVAYLLWHTLFADSYPIDISGDLNADGSVDDQDVAYLLWHTLFPDAYPL